MRMTATLIIAIALLYCSQVALADCKTESATFDEEKVLQLLIDRLGDEVTRVLGLYEERCDGSLHLVDMDRKTKLVRVNMAWWLEEFHSATFDESGNEIRVNASYITGIGPEGARPFDAEYVLKRRGSRWITTSEHFPDPEEQPAPARERGTEKKQVVWQVHSQAQFDALNLRSRGQPVSLEADFGQQRIVLATVWLTSGSANIEEFQVRKFGGSYIFSYRVKYPKIGTTDMKQSILYAVMPKDDLPVAVRLRGRGFFQPGERVDVVNGVIDRGALDTPR